MRTLGLVGAFVVVSMVALVLALVWRVQDQNRIESLARQTNTALCAFKTDLQRRHASGEKYLAEHPRGIPGITAREIRLSLDNQEATLDALSGLACH